MRADEFELRRTKAGIVAEIVCGAARGHTVTLLVRDSHSAVQIEAAKRQLRKELDVVMMQVRRVD